LVLSSPTQALLVSDFGPKISFRIVDTLREEIRDGMLKSGSEIKVGSVPNIMAS
jgi:fused signal recognition particle receptor